MFRDFSGWGSRESTGIDRPKRVLLGALGVAQAMRRKEEKFSAPDQQPGAEVRMWLPPAPLGVVHGYYIA